MQPTNTGSDGEEGNDEQLSVDGLSSALFGQAKRFGSSAISHATSMGGQLIKEYGSASISLALLARRLQMLSDWLSDLKTDQDVACASRALWGKLAHLPSSDAWRRAIYKSFDEGKTRELSKSATVKAIVTMAKTVITNVNKETSDHAQFIASWTEVVSNKSLDKLIESSSATVVAILSVFGENGQKINYKRMALFFLTPDVKLDLEHSQNLCNVKYEFEFSDEEDPHWLFTQGLLETLYHMTSRDSHAAAVGSLLDQDVYQWGLDDDYLDADDKAINDNKNVGQTLSVDSESSVLQVASYSGDSVPLGDFEDEFGSSDAWVGDSYCAVDHDDLTPSPSDSDLHSNHSDARQQLNESEENVHIHELHNFHSGSNGNHTGAMTGSIIDHSHFPVEPLLSAQHTDPLFATNSRLFFSQLGSDVNTHLSRIEKKAIDEALIIFQTQAREIDEQTLSGLFTLDLRPFDKTVIALPLGASYIDSEE